ncbi:hypothetical protein [Kitasatospora sp. NPDC001175]|uniref:hypothetical protein n=1 Tax=Kitasatospora sp. NPDC001175 TaxID=3157103 RepID=UPI003CFCB998
MHDPATGKAWHTSCQGDVVELVSGAPGRERRSAKAMDGAEAAVAHAQKQEWARLRKGFVLSDPSAAAGQPVMHRYLGPSYTGAMVAEAVEGRLLCNRFDDTGQRDRLLLVAQDGSLADSISLPPNRLAWQARPALLRALVGQLALPRCHASAARWRMLREPLTSACSRTPQARHANVAWSTRFCLWVCQQAEHWREVWAGLTCARGTPACWALYFRRPVAGAQRGSERVRLIRRRLQFHLHHDLHVTDRS